MIFDRFFLFLLSIRPTIFSELLVFPVIIFLNDYYVCIIFAFVQLNIIKLKFIKIRLNYSVCNKHFLENQKFSENRSSPNLKKNRKLRILVILLKIKHSKDIKNLR